MTEEHTGPYEPGHEPAPPLRPPTEEEARRPDITDEKRVRTRRSFITPERAKKLLEANTRNRQPSPREVSKLARVMVSGEWVYNGEAIKLSESGQVLDGQHRLMACVEAGVPFETLVIDGFSDRIFSTLDQGRRRSGADVLFIKGVKRHAIVSKACESIYRVIKNRPIYGGIDRIPSYGIEKIFERHTGIETAADYCASVLLRGDATIVAHGQLAAFYYVMDTLLGQSEKAAAFVEGVIIGAGLGEDDPLLRFKNRVSDAQRRNTTMQGQDKTALLTKVAGMHLMGERVGKSLTQPSTTETYYSLLPGLEEAVTLLDPQERLVDIDY